MAAPLSNILMQPSLAVFYDGQCPLCSAEIDHYRRIDKSSEIQWLDLHHNTASLAEYDIGFDQAMGELHAVIYAADKSGTIVTGVDSFLEIWKRLDRYRWLSHLVGWRPVKYLTEYAYKVFARGRFNRRKARMCGSNCAT